MSRKKIRRAVRGICGTKLNEVVLVVFLQIKYLLHAKKDPRHNFDFLQGLIPNF